MSSSARHELRLPDWLVVNRNFVLLWLAYGIAAVGDHLSEMALLSERDAMEGDHATRVQALIQFGFFLPFVLLGPIAGWWSDRFSRKVTMIAADVLRAVLVFNLAYLVAQLGVWLEPQRYPDAPTLLPWFAPLPAPAAEPQPGLGDYAIVIPLAVVGALAAFFSPARQAMLPTLIRDDQIVRANAMINALGTIGGISGAVVGGFLVARLGRQGLHYNYYINAATFALSALLVGSILMSRTRAAPRQPLAGVWAPIVQGFRYVRQHRRILQLILLGAVFWGAAGVITAVVPALVRDVFKGSISDVPIYRGLIVIGLAVGAAVMSLVGPALPLRLAVLIGLGAGGAWVAALVATAIFTTSGVLTGICLFGLGGAGAVILVTMLSAIQRFVPDSRRGRVCGVSDMATMGAMVLTSALLGLPDIPHLDRYVPWLLAATALLLLGACVAAWRIYRHGARVSGLIDLLWQLIRFYARFWCGLKRVGPCTIPTRGPVILAANHTSGVDATLILAASPQRLVSFLVERRHYQQPLVRWMMRLAGCVPIRQERPTTGFVRGALHVLESGGVLGVFPQGRLVSREERDAPAQPGVGLLALRSNATVIPCHISGTTYHDNPWRALFMRHAARVRFGPPVDLSVFKDRRDRQATRAAAAAIMKAIEELDPSRT